MLMAFCFSDGDMDSLLDSVTLDSSEPSPLSSSQESSEDTHSPKDSQSPKESSSSPRDTCSGEIQIQTEVYTVISVTYNSDQEDNHSVKK